MNAIAREQLYLRPRSLSHEAECACPPTYRREAEKRAAEHRPGAGRRKGRARPTRWIPGTAPIVRLPLAGSGRTRNNRLGRKPASIGIGMLSDAERYDYQLLAWELESEGVYDHRPVTLEDCGPRPCPWCKENVIMKMEQWNEDDRSLWQTVHEADRPLSARDEEAADGDAAHVVVPVRLRQDGDSGRRRTKDEQHEELRVSGSSARKLRNAGVQGVGVDDRALRDSDAQQIQGLRRTRNQGVRPLARELSELPGGHGIEANGEAFTRPLSRQQRQLRARELPVGDDEAAVEEQAKLSCPNCGRGVRYDRGLGGEDWAWAPNDPGKGPARLEPGARREYAAALNHAGPCPWTACEFNLYVDLIPPQKCSACGADSISEQHYLATHRCNHCDARLPPFVKLNFPGLDVDQIPETCSLRVANSAERDGGLTLEAIGRLMNLTMGRADQLEKSGVGKLAVVAEAQGWGERFKQALAARQAKQAAAKRDAAPKGDRA